MKLEKREITLNEYDSLKDAYYLEKTLLREYAEGREVTERKETEGELSRLMREVGEDMEKTYQLMKKSEGKGNFSLKT
jgi:hypothetical protein